MDISRNLALFWGIIISILALVPLINKRMAEAEKESKTNYSTIFILGLIALIAGALQVSFYNVWELNYRGLITAMGWITVIRSGLRLLFPESNRKAMQMANADRIIWISSLTALALGLYFIAAAFTLIPHWLGG